MENQWLHDPIIIPARLHSAQVGVSRFWSPCSGECIYLLGFHTCWDFICVRDFICAGNFTCAGISYVLGFHMCQDCICAGISFSIVLTSLYNEPTYWHRNASMNDLKGLGGYGLYPLSSPTDDGFIKFLVLATWIKHTFWKLKTTNERIMREYASKQTL